ncbi:hypothetical protein ACFCZY_38345 [Streptomyces sp. NPDC056237]|uniref:hypothetical protein n=1 Tax=unclassified Streptomyces TaxID=2593676 RepID=UPI0035DEE10C
MRRDDLAGERGRAYGPFRSARGAGISWLRDGAQGWLGTAHLEVSVLRAADWEKAVMTGYAAWRQLRKHGGGRLALDLDAQTLTFLEP